MLHKRPGFEPWPYCCEATVLTTKPLCCPLMEKMFLLFSRLTSVRVWLPGGSAGQRVFQSACPFSKSFQWNLPRWLCGTKHQAQPGYLITALWEFPYHDASISKWGIKNKNIKSDRIQRASAWLLYFIFTSMTEGYFEYKFFNVKGNVSFFVVFQAFITSDLMWQTL